MSSLTEAELDQAGADYRAAKAAVGVALRRQHDAELSGVNVAQRVADVAWCRALVVACGEVYKGCTFAEVVA